MTPERSQRGDRRSRAFATARALAVVLLCVSVLACTSGKSPYKQGVMQAKAGDYDKAVLSFSKALNSEPGNAEYRMALSRARFRASQQHFDKAKRYLQATRLALAVEELQAAVFLDPTNDYAAIELEKAQLALEQELDARVAVDTLEDLKRQARASLEPPKLDPSSNVPITLKFKDEELGKIFDALSKATGINFLYDDRVELNKRVSIDQANVTFEEAMDLLMIQNKLFYKVHNPSTLIIIPDQRQKRQEYEDQVIKTFYLSNAEVKDVQTILRTLLDARKVAVNDQLNSITIKDTPDTVAVAQKLVQFSDKAKSEVVIDVEILEINRNTFQNLGIDISTSSASLVFQGGESLNGGQFLRLNDLNAINNTAAWVLGPVPNVVINFLKTDSDAQVLAKPQVRVSEGERAQLNIGQRVPIPTTSFNTANTVGGNIVPLTSFTYQNVGISVELEPRVHHNREVTLNVAVEISALAGNIATTGGQSQPIIGTRNINTVIRLKEGETQILAGLIQENERKSLRTVPGLDKIPILRKIFGTNETNIERQDIILTLTPRIVRLPDIRADDLAALWVGTGGNLSLRGAERSPFGSDTPFTSDDEIGGSGDGTGSGFGAGGTDDADDFDDDNLDDTGSGDVDTGDDEGGDDADDDEEQPPAVVLSMIPTNPQPAVGDFVDILIRIFNAKNVVSTPFKLKFDASHLRFVREGATQGPFLASAGNVVFLAQPDSQDASVVSVGLSVLGAQQGVDNAGDLCTLRFQVLPGAGAAGTTSIIPFDNRVFAPGLQEIPSVFQSLTLVIQGAQ